MSDNQFDLVAASRQEMIADGFLPDIPADAINQLRTIQTTRNSASDSKVRDLTGLLWSSIDNDDSRDLDQIEWAEQTPAGIRVLVGIADVDSLVAKDTPIDRYAARETTTVYAGIHTYPMLPEKLSTDLTSLAEEGDRAAVVVEFVVQDDGSLASPAIYPARVRNRAQLAYNATGAWLEGKAAAPPKVAASAELQAQLRLQHQAADKLRGARYRLGALDFDRIEAQPVIVDGRVRDIKARVSNFATCLIEDFMIAANETMARSLSDAGVSSIRRIVKDPERWNRIVALAHGLGESLPTTPDAGALNQFLIKRKAADPDRYEDLSLSVLKLMGPGEYVLSRAGGDAPGHFGLAAHDYTHSTAPNRRFADLVTQRLIKALLENPSGRESAPYSDEELDAIARNCTLKEDASRKVQRNMLKRMAAVAMQDRIGQKFQGVVTGASEKGVFVRIANPPVEGRVMRGEQGLDVGDRVSVSLMSADPVRGFIDFARA